MHMQIRSPGSEPIKIPSKDTKVRPAISEKNIEKYEATASSQGPVYKEGYKENRPPIAHLKPALGAVPVLKTSENSLEVKAKKKFVKDFVEIYFQKEGRGKLLGNLEKMTDSEFKFFMDSLVSYLSEKSNGQLFMSPILKDSLPQGSMIGKRPFEVRKIKGKTVLKLISNERLAKLSKAQKKNIKWIEHNGNDIPTQKGTPVFLPAPGVVTEIKEFKLFLAKDKKPTKNRSKEFSITVEHAGGFKTKFVHVGSELPAYIKKDAKLDFGTLMGSIDGRASFRMTENKTLKVHSTGSHLHFEVLDREGNRRNYHEVTLLTPEKLSFSQEDKKMSFRVKTNEFLAYFQSKKDQLAFRLTQRSV